MLFKLFNNFENNVDLCQPNTVPDLGRRIIKLFLGYNNFLEHLIPTQIMDVSNIILDYTEVISDTPAICNIFKHDVKLLPNTVPIRQAPYHLSPAKKL